MGALRSAGKKFVGDEKKIGTLFPLCGTGPNGRVEEEKTVSPSLGDRQEEFFSNREEERDGKGAYCLFDPDR